MTSAPAVATAEVLAKEVARRDPVKLQRTDRTGVMGTQHGPPRPGETFLPNHHPARPDDARVSNINTKEKRIQSGKKSHGKATR